MKRLFLLLIFLSSSTFTFAETDYTQDANCEAAWLFSEGSGTTVADSSANSNIGTFLASGSPVWTSDVPSGAIVDYSADFIPNDYINVNDDNSLDITTNLTLIVWFKHDVYTTQQLLAKDGSGGNARSYGIFHHSDKKFGGSVFKSGDTESVYKNTTILYTDSWYNVALTYKYIGDGSSELKTYITGGNVQGITNAVGPIQSTSTNVRIGSRVYSGAEGYWDGHITEAAIFSRTLSSTEIADIYANGLAQVSGIPVSNNYIVEGMVLKGIILY